MLTSRTSRTTTNKLVVASALVMGLTILACAGSRRSVESPVDLAINPIGAEGGTTILTNGERSPSTKDGKCTLRLVAARIEKSSPGCYLDEHVSEGPGILHYPCSGDGPAEAVFNQQTYAGRMQGGDVELQTTTELDWEDGCKWGTDASISGNVLNRNEPSGRRLTWTYRDRIVSGTGCSGLCTAKSTFDVRPMTTKVPSNHDDDDDDDDE
jgi:hypothetical protein